MEVHQKAGAPTAVCRTLVDRVCEEAHVREKTTRARMTTVQTRASSAQISPSPVTRAINQQTLHANHQKAAAVGFVPTRARGFSRLLAALQIVSGRP